MNFDADCKFRMQVKILVMVMGCWDVFFFQLQHGAKQGCDDDLIEI